MFKTVIIFAVRFAKRVERKIEKMNDFDWVLEGHMI